MLRIHEKCDQNPEMRPKLRIKSQQMRLLHHYPTLSHSFLRNATRLFGFHETYRLVDVYASQRKKKTAVFHNEKTATFHSEKDHHISQRKNRHVS